ncbi:MAG: M48 family metalloprotease [Candidatus Marsarchaeota archaeon]|jgi:heat shock protein HtpX|nr:M48 family metalloprotease [Candidatus Marsarchaeota archaeon]MCL5433899.1 M48 family metalloprotease [Candidatus Marsarchaeota archaeon]
MASFFDEINKNKMKSILLMIIFGLLFAGVVYLVDIIFGGGLIGLVAGLALIVIYALFVYSLGDKFVLKVSKAKPADKSQYKDLYDIVDEVATGLQIQPPPKIYIINDQNPNAFATGKNKKSASIAVTTGLLSMMNHEELEGVISHEMSHIYNNDIQFMLIATVFAGIIGLIAAIFRSMLFFGGFGMGGRGSRNGGDSTLILLVLAVVIGIFAALFATLLKLAISRRREYMADANGARITRAPKYLASALKKIQAYENNPTAQPVKNANEITASLYFANPLKRKSIMNLFSTHPPIEDRIKKLEEMY